MWCAAALALLLPALAAPARAGGLAALDPADRELFCALGGDAYRPSLPNHPWPTRPELRRADSLLEEIDAELCMARFRGALERAEEARSELRVMPPSWALRTRRARLEALAATAEIALGDEARGRESFTRALELDPGLRLDPRRTSPKLLRLFDEARASRLASR